MRLLSTMTRKQLHRLSQMKPARSQDMTAWKLLQKTEQHSYSWDMVLHIQQMSTYDQMQTQMEDPGFTNAFIGTVEGEPEDPECQAVIEKVKEAGFKKVVLRPLMVVAR